MEISFVDIQARYKEIEKTMNIIYNDYGYFSKKILIDIVMKNTFDANSFYTVKIIFADMWFVLPDNIFNIMTKEGREFLDLCELINEFNYKEITK